MDICKLKEKGKVNAIIKAVHYLKDSQIRYEALCAIEELHATNAIGDILQNLTSEKDTTVKRKSAAVLGKLGWKPESRDRIAAMFWGYSHDYEKCVQCGAEHAIEPLLEMIISKSLNMDAINAYVKLGLPALQSLAANTTAVYQYYLNFISQVNSLDFRHAEDAAKSAQIENLAGMLGNCAYTIGRFNIPLGEQYLMELYRNVKNRVYSADHGGFGDLYKAVKLRSSIVAALKYTYTQAGAGFLAEVLENDGAFFVRWEAIDILAKMAEESPSYIMNEKIANALKKALSIEPDSVSSRKRKIQELLAKLAPAAR